MRTWTVAGYPALVFLLLLAASARGATEVPKSKRTDRNYASVQAYLREVESKNAGRAELLTLGSNDSGDKIEGLKIGSGPVKNIVVATHHGNEYGSSEVGLSVAASLAAAPIVGQTVYVVPVLNIGGYNVRSRNERNAAGSHDPNRDYPGPCGTDGPFNLKSTKALADFIDREGIVASATLHTYYPAVVYPWGMSTRDLSTPYNDLFKLLTQAATVESGYEIGNSTEVIYPADGTYEDYAFWKHGIWSILFELGFSHSPTQPEIDEMTRVNVPGIRRMLEQAPTARAENHAFTGRCDIRLKSLDRRDE